MTVNLVQSGAQRRQVMIGEPMGETRATVTLTNALDDGRVAEGMLPEDQVRSITVDAVVDTGAVRCVIPQSVVNVLGVLVRRETVAAYADGRDEVVGLTDAILFNIMGRTTADEALVLGKEVLIGQTVLEKLDLLADCTNRRLIPNPDHPNQPVTRV
jgi:clan AA aspartic protease